MQNYNVFAGHNSENSDNHLEKSTIGLSITHSN